MRATEGAAPEIARLLGQVDAALARWDAGTFGLCNACGDPVEADRLRADPLIRFCLDHLDDSERQSLERDLALAARVQTGLLPKAASLLSSHLHGLFRTLRDVGGSARDMIERADRLFRESTLESHYVTLVLGRASRDGGIEICNAAQGPPILKTGGRVAPGASLVLYTDGVTQARNGNGAEFRLEGLLRAVAGVDGSRSAPELAAACLEEVDRFGGPVPRHDDARHPTALSRNESAERSTSSDDATSRSSLSRTSSCPWGWWGSRDRETAPMRFDRRAVGT